jgi:gliding motility-associated-like protein
VVVLNNITSAAFEAEAIDMCDSMVVNFAITESSPSMQFSWFFGNGEVSNSLNPTYTYYEPGTYEVMLAVYDSLSCNPYDTVFTTIVFDSVVVATISQDSVSGCAPLPVDYFAGGVGATSYLWVFGDGSTSTDSVTTHVYETPGVYTAMLIATNPEFCNVSDTAFMTVTVLPPAPVASFTATQSESNPRLYTFTNQSTGATTYAWDFGDGGLSSEVDPTHIYGGVGQYEVCLVAMNTGPCPDDTCQRFDVTFFPAIDVPNAFSPNGDGQNDILYVRGYNVQTMLFKVFNRWGEKVFETNDLNIGWNGTYKSEEQEMDVFAWTLNAVLISGEIVERKGNVTLIR